MSFFLNVARITTTILIVHMCNTHTYDAWIVQRGVCTEQRPHSNDLRKRFRFYFFFQTITWRRKFQSIQSVDEMNQLWVLMIVELKIKTNDCRWQNLLLYNSQKCPVSQIIQSFIYQCLQCHKPLKTVLFYFQSSDMQSKARALLLFIIRWNRYIMR